MERKKYVIVTAGGIGSRMGSSVPKQFLELGGKPILRLTIERFLEAVPDVHILTVLPQEHVNYWRSYCLKAGFVCPQRLVVGGFTRFHSVKNALGYVPDGALAAVHDAVRPLVSAGLIRTLFEAAGSAPAVIPVMPVTDTLKVLEKDSEGILRASGEAIDRSRIWSAQTPQVFHSELLKAAYSEEGYDTLFTDDASVAERHGIPLTFLPGERNNLKITTQEDLDLALSILSNVQSK
ncbi:MAG: 2-C-methyl-D-erythritol 4-phosphate cytidylyltransferase [Bacteroidales bacterium]|nr:2-C-methyl-D-erythritol 4-phosphate cytidylyltransferase [Bacteroidales bacterium]